MEVLKGMGAEVEELDLSSEICPAYYIIASAEASSNLSRFDGSSTSTVRKEFEGIHEMYKKTRSKDLEKK